MSSFTCPVCGWTSHHRTDVREGYCGHCHDWTGTPMTGKDYEAWRKAQWPPPGLDMGQRAEWLSPVDTAGLQERLVAAVPYIRAVLTGDDSVAPDVATAEIALSLVCGWLGAAAAPRRLDDYLSDIEAVIRGRVDGEGVGPSTNGA